MSGARAEYIRRIEFWNAAAARANRAHLLVSNARLVVAGVTGVLAWQAFVSHRGSVAWPVAGLVAFVVLVALHARVLRRIERASRARQLYERGIARLDSTWADTGPDGMRFLEGHAFARDIDLFGPGSLFQLLHVARTDIGEETLAAWLVDGAGVGQIRERQASVTELSPMVDFREDLAVLAAEAGVINARSLATWAASSPAGLSAVPSITFAALAIVSATLTGLWLVGRAPVSSLMLWLLVQAAVERLWHARIGLVLSRIDTAEQDLGLLSSLFERIEREPFVSPGLVTIRQALDVDHAPPSVRIARLQRIVSFLDQATHNLLLRPVGAMLLARGQAAIAIDRWHVANGRAVGDWLRAVGDLEALASLGTYAYEHPTDPFPDLVETDVAFDATGLAHPLIDERVVVRNDVRLGGPNPHALIVSGSNMSGKSTLLRAIGVNVVLALAGAPVRAVTARLSRLRIGSTMRIDDSLQAGHSRFYAEILRIRAIVELSRAGHPVLFLLDEILGGTNSYDRRIGAEAIIRRLVDAGAIGLITTHDLALTALASQLSSSIANVHFEDRIENGALIFDYRMRPGVVQGSNALELMRSIGLDV